MNAQGLFFLRQPASSAITADGQRSLILPLCERAGRQVRHVTAIWLGPVAAQFFDRHSFYGQLRAGCALQLELSNVHVLNNELHAHVVTCELAPQRWQGRANPHGSLADPLPLPQP